MIYIYITLGVAVLVITVLALVGRNVKRQEKKLREQFNLDDTTTPEELKKAVERFKRKNLMTNAQRIFEWLSSKGYTHRPAYMKIPISPQPHQRPKSKLSSYEKAVMLFSKLKREKRIEIYPAKKNKFGIPYYEIRKTVAQQIRGIE